MTSRFSRFREYLNLQTGNQFKYYSLTDILEKSEEITKRDNTKS